MFSVAVLTYLISSILVSRELVERPYDWVIADDNQQTLPRLAYLANVKLCNGMQTKRLTGFFHLD
jgi:hypothetical protein